MVASLMIKIFTDQAIANNHPDPDSTLLIVAAV
jgi:hypothetical protein